MNRMEFNGILPVWLILPISLLGMAFVWWWYYRESKYSRAPFHWLLPTLRALAFGGILWMLAGPAWVREWVSGELSRLAILVDTSSSMEFQDSGSLDSSRLDRAERWLSSRSEKEAGWLDRQRKQFHLRVFSSTNAEQSVWDSVLNPSGKQTQISFPTTSSQTAIGDSLSSVIRSRSALASPTKKSDPALEQVAAPEKPYAAVVLLSDGQNNFGESPSTVAERFAQSNIPVFTVGFGKDTEPEDLGLLAVDHSRSMFRTDSLQGVATLKQQLPTGRPYRVLIRSGGEVVWSKSFESDGASRRAIEFRIPGEKLISNEQSTSRSKAVPIELDFEVQHEGADASKENNKLESSLWGNIRKNRVVVMDPRGRWEARYVKNAFQRDSSWELESILGPSEFKENPFPKSREQTLGVDLIVMAADGLASMNESQVRWISDFVEELGGGLILIDSGRDAKQDSEAKLDSTGKNKVDWLPVQYTEETAPLPVSGLKLEEAAIEQRAFAFEQDAAANRQLWEAFPAPRIARRVKPAPGSEVMVSGKSESGNYPMIVSRRSGQGRVVYLSNDETWRWRYNVADLYHQRFWNQLGQWTMQPPFAIENDYVALDSGDRTYEFGRDIMLRAKLRDTDRAALSKARAIAVIERDGQRIDSVPLSEDVEGSGIYSSLAKGLEPGRYQVRIEVPGLPSEALDMKTEFLIHPPQDIEREILAANRPLLEQIAKTTGGKYYDESQADRIDDSLESFKTGKIEQSRTLLWQSYPWFLAIMSILALEWYLRKKAGFI